MVKKSFVLLSMLILGFSLLSFASAEIALSQINPSYALGDKIAFTISLDSLKFGYLDVSLVCGDKTSGLYQNVPDNTSIALSRELTPSYIDSLSGECYIKAEYAGASKESTHFTIQNNARIEFDSSNLSVIAGNSIAIKGKVYLENGNLMNINPAFVEVSFNNISSTTSLNNGAFEVNFDVPANLKKGDYVVEAKAYDVDSQNNKLNSGGNFTSLLVFQVPAKINIALDKVSITPGDVVIVIPFVKDMAGEEYPGDLLLQLTDGNDNIIFQGNVEANKEFILSTLTNYSAGKTKIIGQKDNLTGYNEIEVGTLEKLEIAINNYTMKIINVGNVPYKNLLEIKIGDKSILKNIDLGLGESQEYAMSAPAGEYQVSVKDDKADFYSGSVPLTGNTIGLYEPGMGISGLIAKYPIVWLFILVVIIALIYAAYRKRKFGRVFFLASSERTPFIGRNFKVKNKSGYSNEHIEIPIPSKANSSKNKFIEMDESVNGARPVSDIHGYKQPVSVVVVKAKSQLTGIAEDYIKKCIEKAKSHKGAAYVTGNSITIIFSPLITKTFKNEEAAVKTAQEIETMLKEHNKKFRDKIDFGIGLNTGDIINAKEKEILEFSSTGKTISIAKQMAELSNSEALLSPEIHQKTLSEIKTEPINNGQAFRIKRIVDNSEASKFMSDFMRRS